MESRNRASGWFDGTDTGFDLLVVEGVKDLTLLYVVSTWYKVKNGQLLGASGPQQTLRNPMEGEVFIPV